MPRTTIDIDAPVLRDLKRLQKQERKSLGRLVSELVTKALHNSKAVHAGPSSFRWISRSMRAQIDLTDKEAVYEALDRQHGHRSAQR